MGSVVRGFHFSAFIYPLIPYNLQMVRLYKDPKGDAIFTHVTNDATGAAAAAASGAGIATCDEHDRVINLEKKVKELQAQLAVQCEVQYYCSLQYESSGKGSLCIQVAC